METAVRCELRPSALSFGTTTTWCGSRPDCYHAGAVLLWRLYDEQGERRERTALTLVGMGFLVLGAFVAYESAESLILREAPDASYAGIGLAVASLAVMPLLARAKRKVASRLESDAQHADSRQTDICACLSAVLLLGLVANAVLGWWWADPVAGLLMVALIVKEGILALRGKACSCARHGCS